MNRIPPQPLKALEFEKSDGMIDLATGGDSVTYEVGIWDCFLLQLPISSSGGVWSGGQTIAVTCSLDGSNFVTFGGLPALTSAQMADSVFGPIAVSGFKNIRFAVAGASGSVGDNKLKPIVRAYQSP